MNKTITKWRPDTCGCEIDYEWDRDLPADQVVHTAVNTILCDVHSGTNEEVFSKVIKENVTKNKVVGKIMEDSEIAEDEVIGGGIKRKLKPGIDVKWSFDKDRNLEVEVLGVDNAKKAALLVEVSKDATLTNFNIK